MAKHNVFISFHSKDIKIKEEFERKFGHLFISKSVDEGDINEDHPSEYVKRLINEGFLDEASVVIVLVGEKTYCRKHVDWELYGGLSKKVGGRSGLVAICIPGNPDYPGDTYSNNNTPMRLVDNLKSGFAKYYDWSENEHSVSRWIEEAFNARLEKTELVVNDRIQLMQDLCS